MKVIGLVGGVASGKSRVSQMFGELGAEILDADRLGHEVLREPDVIQALRDRWGPDIVGGTGAIDRAAVARRVFAGTPGAHAELEFLESVTHGRITAAIRERIDKLSQGAGVPAVVLDAPVMLEAGWDGICDKIVFVETNYQKRLERALQRGWKEEEFAAREAAQLSLDEKRKVADWVIDNSGSIDHTFAQVRQFWRSLSLSPPD